MKLITYLSVSTLIAHAFAALEAKNATKIDVEDVVKLGCNGGNGKWSAVTNGMEFSCDKPAWARPHYIFYTVTNMKGSEGSFTIDRGATGYVVPGSNLEYKFGGCVDASWGTYRCLFYNYQKSTENVVNLPEICTSDSVFCFDDFSHVCTFAFGNQKWERACPNLNTIEFNQ